jgi:hypothetical protein
MCDKICGVDDLSYICTAYIIDSTDVITNAELGSSTPQMLS